MGILKVNGSMPKINCNVPLNKINCNGATVWTRELIIFNNGVTRSGDAFNGQIYYNNADAGKASGYASYDGGTLNASVDMTQLDRQIYCGGMLKLPIDISGFSTLHITCGANLPNPSFANVEFGLSSALLGSGGLGGYLKYDATNGYYKALPGKLSAINTITTHGQEFTLNLSAYKSAYGNSGYFTWFANKFAFGGGAGKASISIIKVWFT